jgi:mono/diheme cytochrome c family protein
MKFLLGLIIGPLVLVLFAYFYIRMGYAPVATASPMLPFERQLTSWALKARVSKELPNNPPTNPSDEDLAEGARIYREKCAVCHGMRDGEKTAIAKGMFPRPPLLLHGKGVTDDPVGETFWKVKNGIRLTGMPAFVGSLTDSQLWQVSFLMARADKLPAAAMAALDAPPLDIPQLKVGK